MNTASSDREAATRGRHVVLVGMMGSGKTTVGRLVADRLGRDFVDSDEVIEAATGRTVREIFESDGEPAFRALESESLTGALASSEPVVVAAAGGTVLAEANRRSMRDAGTVVWLRADPSVLAVRVGGGGHRPLLDDDPELVLQRLAGEREVLYREVADVVVDVSSATPEEVADDVLDVLS